MSSDKITIEPILRFPRYAQAGRSYIASIDLSHKTAPHNWPYDREEFAISCRLETWPLFEYRTLDDPTLILHRFGGTYGEVRFLLKASSEPIEGTIRILLVNESGLLLDEIEIENVHVMGKDAASEPEGEHVGDIFVDKEKKKRCAVIMTFGNEGNSEYSANREIYQAAILPAVKECGYECVRAEELEDNGIITKDIMLLFTSDLAIVDLSSGDAKALYELGVRHAFYRMGTIQIIRKGETLPFDFLEDGALFYTTEDDWPEKLKRELKRKIREYERKELKSLDNFVHDVLSNKLPSSPDLNDYVPIGVHNETVRAIESQGDESEKLREKNKEIEGQIQAALREKADLEKRLDELIKKVHNIKLRSTPLDNLSDNEVEKMLKERHFFDRYWNKQGKGIKHQYEVVERKVKKLVIDHTTDLTWQQSGSTNYMSYADAQKYIKQLNDKHFAGYNDWRMPTLEEAMSLIESEKYGELHIDKRFDHLQSWIWTADKKSGSGVWVVFFDIGNCFLNRVVNNNFVRAVR